MTKDLTKKATRGAALFAVLLIAACAETGVYPISGEECTASDPVHTMTAPPCVPGGAP